MVNADTALDIRRVSRRFGDLWAVRDISAQVSPGETVAFVGSNGAGKTTLFHLITGTLRADAGRVFFFGREISGLPAWRVARLGIGRQFQSARVFRNLTVAENLLVAASPVEHPRWKPWSAFRRDRVLLAEARRCLARVGLEGAETRLAGTMSVGERRLLTLAQVLIRRDRLLLLDEPTAGLSPEAREKMVSLLQAVVEERGVTVALVEHDMAAVSRLADRAYFLHEGRVVCEGRTREVLSHPEVTALYRGQPAPPPGEGSRDA